MKCSPKPVQIWHFFQKLVLLYKKWKHDVIVLTDACSLQIWANYEEKPVEEVVHVTEEKERVANYRAVFVTEITDTLHIYAQDVETGIYRDS